MTEEQKRGRKVVVHVGVEHKNNEGICGAKPWQNQTARHVVVLPITPEQNAWMDAARRQGAVCPVCMKIVDAWNNGVHEGRQRQMMEMFGTQRLPATMH